MSWERRARGGSYYTRSTRNGERVIRQYVGCSAAAERIAELDAADRVAKENRRAARTRERNDVASLRRTLGTLDAELNELLTGVLEASGYHHHRGQWRRRRTN